MVFDYIIDCTFDQMRRRLERLENRITLHGGNNDITVQTVYNITKSGNSYVSGKFKLFTTLPNLITRMALVSSNCLQHYQI